MTLAICKEILGYVRGKYGTVPIPNADVTLNQSDLLAAATAEKTALLERLRAYFDETSRAALLARKASEKESMDKELEGVPNFIYIG
jgi:aspartate ammonia-lyase